MPGTAAMTASFLFAPALGNAPTQVSIPAHHHERLTEDAYSWVARLLATTQGNSAITAAQTRATSTSDLQQALWSVRQTTPSEHVVGELRRWGLLSENW